jgi:16S rRNA G527 N7-methylase RsmG
MRVEDFRALVATRMLGICEVEDDALGKLARHHELFDRWNQRNDRTAVRDTGEAVEQHYCEGIFVAAHVPRGTLSIADIGSGLGFPGAVIAAVHPRISVHLVETNLDKALFLRDSTRGWPNVKVRSARASNLPDHFDLLVARGMSPKSIVELMPKLSSAALILTTAAEAELLQDQAVLEHSTLSVEPPLPLPWMEKRLLVRVSHVPRGTP